MPRNGLIMSPRVPISNGLTCRISPYLRISSPRSKSMMRANSSRPYQMSARMATTRRVLNEEVLRPKGPRTSTTRGRGRVCSCVTRTTRSRRDILSERYCVGRGSRRRNNSRRFATVSTSVHRFCVFCLRSFLLVFQI